ncbi:winged helix-turn-helix transcriptional regulator [Nocardia takedensis]|uniref:winged helix-turn-helix transcriptional regulator n=1 Tax=Nocardia takedensis TaxID=259390 RepID=UPI00059309F7|nr:helix-turn-helix domain-containing protein [Nocardia takedensis]
MRSANGPDDPGHAPIRTAIEVLGQRWVLRIVWELEPGPLGFLELRRRMGNCSSSMLSNRLQQLQTVGLIEKHGPKGAYELTAVGVGLSEALQPLWDWSESWEPGSTGGPWFRGESGRRS